MSTSQRSDNSEKVEDAAQVDMRRAIKLIVMIKRLVTVTQGLTKSECNGGELRALRRGEEEEERKEERGAKNARIIQVWYTQTVYDFRIAMGKVPKSRKLIRSERGVLESMRRPNRKGWYNQVGSLDMPSYPIMNTGFGNEGKNPGFVTPQISSDWVGSSTAYRNLDHNYPL